MTKLLLVEDDPSIVENLTDFLCGEGFALRAVDGQQKAIDCLESERFDLVLLDISLAQGNGYAVCAAVKAKTDLPVIFLTASGDEFSVITGLDMGRMIMSASPSAP